MCWTCLFFSLSLLFFCFRAVQVGSSPPSGAASVIWCPMGRQRCMWRKANLPKLQRRDARTRRNDPASIGPSQARDETQRAERRSRDDLLLLLLASASVDLQEERRGRGWGGVWSEASECDVFIGLLLSDCLICLPAHCLCQLLFKGISLQVQLRRESLVPPTCFSSSRPCLYLPCVLAFVVKPGPPVWFWRQRGNKNSRCSSAFEAWGREKKTSSYTNTLWC